MSDTMQATYHVTDALIAMLGTVCDVPVGDGDAPRVDGETPDLYLVVDLVPGGGLAGDAAHPGSMSILVYQVAAAASVPAEDRDRRQAQRWQAEALAGRARAAILGRVEGTGAFTHPVDAYAVNGGAKTLGDDDGVVVWWRELDSAGGTLVEGRTFNSVDRFVLHVAPTT